MISPSASTPISRPDVELCTISDGDYAIPAVVMLTSAKANKAPEHRYRAHLMLTSPNPFVEQQARSLNSPDFELIVHHVELTAAERQLSENRLFFHISGTTLVRCRLGTLLPEVPRVLYLDGDILIRGDLTEFFNKEMEGKCVAGAWDIGEWDGPGTHSRAVVSSNQYVNAGVLLMNLDHMRQTGVCTRMENCEENLPKEWRWADQDIINACCPDQEKLILPPRYNCMIPLYQRHKWNLETINAFYGTHYASFLEMEADSLITHLAGPDKPWNLINCYCSDTWMHYYRLSPFGHMDWPRQLLLPRGLQTLSTPQAADLGILPLVPQYGQLRLRYHYYRLMSKLTWGHLRRRYKEKTRTCRTLLHRIRQYCRDTRRTWGL